MPHGRGPAGSLTSGLQDACIQPRGTTDVLRALQMERNLARFTLQEVKQSVAADALASSHALQELRATMLRGKSASEVSL